MADAALWQYLSSVLRVNRRSFTLLELLMVVIIIAILASIALPQYLRASERARGSEALQILAQLRSAQGRYAAGHKNSTPTVPVFAAVVDDLDAAVPTMVFWEFKALNFKNSSVFFKRTGGFYNNKSLGMVWADGELCGDFSPINPPVFPCP